MIDVEFDPDSLTKTVHALSLLAPDLRDELVKDLKGAGRAVASSAKAKAPSKTGFMRRGYRVKTRVKNDYEVRVSVIAAADKDHPQAAILEFAGSRSSGFSNQGRALIANLSARYGKPGRFMWASYDEVRPDRLVVDAINDAERKLQARLNRTT